MPDVKAEGAANPVSRNLAAISRQSASFASAVQEKSYIPMLA